MFAKTAFGLALVLATASTTLAATKTHSFASSHDVYTNVYNHAGAYVGTDPDRGVRFELNRDSGRGAQ